MKKELMIRIFLRKEHSGRLYYTIYFDFIKLSALYRHLVVKYDVLLKILGSRIDITWIFSSISRFFKVEPSTPQRLQDGCGWNFGDVYSSPSASESSTFRLPVLTSDRKWLFWITFHSLSMKILKIPRLNLLIVKPKKLTFNFNT